MKQQIETRLATAVQDLPPEKILQVIDKEQGSKEQGSKRVCDPAPLRPCSIIVAVAL